MTTKTVSKTKPSSSGVFASKATQEIAAKFTEVDSFGDLIEMIQTGLGTAKKFERAFLMARAMNALESMITDEVMQQDIMPLMNNPLGFKTDRQKWTKNKDGKVIGEYPVATVRACFIQASLKGAYPVENEWNIIAGQAYLTKEYFDRLIKHLPGITNFHYDTGTKTMHDGSALVPAWAEWTEVAGGEVVRFECFDGRTQDPPGPDMRISVSAYKTSTPDEIRGKVLSKLFRRCYEKISGMKFEVADPPVVDGTVVDPANIGSDPNPELPAANNSIYTPAMEAFLQSAEAEFGQAKTQRAVIKTLDARLDEVEQSDWTTEQKALVVGDLQVAAEAKNKAVKRS